jgi:uncharacterized protein YacL
MRLPKIQLQERARPYPFSSSKSKELWKLWKVEEDFLHGSVNILHHLVRVSIHDILSRLTGIFFIYLIIRVIIKLREIPIGFFTGLIDIFFLIFVTFLISRVIMKLKEIEFLPQLHHRWRPSNLHQHSEHLPYELQLAQHNLYLDGL